MRTEDNLCLSRRAACETLGVGLSTLKNLIERGEVRQLRIGRRSLIPRSEIEKYVQRLLAAQEPAERESALVTVRASDVHAKRVEWSDAEAE